MSFKNYKQSIFGFTIIEIMVVVGILSMVSLLTTANIRDAKRGFLLDEIQEGVITAIEESKNNALGGKDGDTVRGHGVYFENDGYGIFADLASSSGFICEKGADDMVGNLVSYPVGVSLTSMPSFLSLCFIAYTGEMYVDGAGVNNGAMHNLALNNEMTAGTKTIVINELGVVGNFISVCGNGVINANETCDDSNVQDDDGCNAACQLEYCGDGVDNNITETCDDGNIVSNDECSAVCQLEYCGDSIRQSNVRPREADGSYIFPTQPTWKEQCEGGSNCDDCRNTGGGGGCGYIAPMNGDSSGSNYLGLLMLAPILVWLVKAGFLSRRIQI